MNIPTYTEKTHVGSLVWRVAVLTVSATALLHSLDVVAQEHPFSLTLEEVVQEHTVGHTLDSVVQGRPVNRRLDTIVPEYAVSHTPVTAAQRPATDPALGDLTQQAKTGLTAERFDCIAEPSAIVQIGSATPGLIGTMNVERNDFVEEGQTLVEFESNVESAVVDSARARVNVTSSIEIQQLNAEFSEQQEQRTRSLFRKNMVSEQEYKRLETETEIAKLQLREAKDNRTLAYLNTLQTEAILDRLTIRSPISGVITERYRSRGEYVDDQPILTIANIDALNVELLVPVVFMGRVREDMKAQVALLPEHFGVHEATVTLVDKVADAPSGTFRVRLQIDNAKHELPAGLRCSAQFSELEEVPVLMSAQPVYQLQPAHHPAHDAITIPDEQP